jgi:large conductance mechanosensitive channel
MDIKKVEEAGKGLGSGVKGLGKGAQGFQDEFMEFLKKYQVIGLAVAFVIGSAATTLVTSIVKDLIMPVIAVVTPSGDWQQALLQIGPVKFAAGDLVSNIINFVIIALSVFLIVKYIMREDATKKL